MPATLDKPQQLREFTNAIGAKVDAAAGVIRGVKILGSVSKNGRRYSEAAISKALALYEGARVNVDHAATATAARGYGDRIGHIASVRREKDGLYGDLHYNPKHRLAEQLAWDAEHSPQNVGLSHNVMASTKRKGSELVVEEVIRVLSVDLVADPATTNGLFESDQSNQPGDYPMSITLADVKADASLLESIRGELIAELRESAETKAKEKQIADLTEQTKTLKAKVDEYEVKDKLAAKKAAVDKLLSEAKLPKEVVTDIFREQLESADEATAKKLIEDRVALAKVTVGKIGGGSPQSKSQHVAEGAGHGGGELPKDVGGFVGRLKSA